MFSGSKVITTVITETSTKEVPIIFRGASFQTTLTESIVKTVTATLFETVPVTIQPTAAFGSFQAASAIAGDGAVAGAIKLLKDRLADQSQASAKSDSETLEHGESQLSQATFVEERGNDFTLEPSKNLDGFSSVVNRRPVRGHQFHDNRT